MLVSRKRIGDIVMDVTNQRKLKAIKDAKNKGHWRIRNHISFINTEIGQYRLTALNNRGTKLSRICNQKANDLERDLSRALDTQ